MMELMMQRSSSSPSILRAATNPNPSTVSSSAFDSSLPVEVDRLPYFHRDIASMQDVFAIVKKYVDHDGHFLLRQSFTKPGTLTVSVLHRRGVKHFNVAKQNGDYFLKDRLFHTINDLILHYRTHDVPNVEGISNVRLATPIFSQAFQTVPRSTSKSLSSSTKSTGSHFIPPNRGNSRSSMSSDSTAKNLNIISTKKPFSMHASSRTTQNSEDLQSTCMFTSDAPQYLFGRLPQNKPSVRCRQRAQPIPENAPNLYYSTVRDPYKELAPNLIRMLCEVEENDSDRCICGLLYDEAELVMGWTMHLSTEPGTEGKLFFMGPDEETAWDLPPEVYLNLSADHQNRIQELLQSKI